MQMKKRQAVIIQIISFIPIVYSLLNLFLFTKNIISIEVIKDSKYFTFIIILIILSMLYIGYLCFEIFKYKEKTYKDYI